MRTLVHNLIEYRYKAVIQDWYRLSLTEKVAVRERRVSAFRLIYPEVQKEVTNYRSRWLMGVPKANVERDFEVYGLELVKMENELQRLIELIKEVNRHRVIVNSSSNL